MPENQLSKEEKEKELELCTAYYILRDADPKITELIGFIKDLHAVLKKLSYFDMSQKDHEYIFELINKFTMEIGIRTEILLNGIDWTTD